MESKKIVLLATKDSSTNIIHNFLQQQFGVHAVIVEERESTKTFVTRRVKRLGVITVIGQVLFQIVIAKPLHYFSNKRRQEIVSENLLDLSEIPIDKITNVASVNDETAIALLENLKPDIVVVNGTRIISKKVLSSVSCKFINIHAGITPKYRGVHGMYWALINNDKENSGVTVHFVDAGIDTGTVIKQVKVMPTKKDNFSTYPLLQLAAALKILSPILSDLFNQKLIIQKEHDTETKLWYHPTIWTYIYNRVMKNVP